MEEQDAAAKSSAQALDATGSLSADGAISPDQLAFKPSKALRKEVVAAFVADVREASPQDADRVPRSLFRLMRGALRSYGLTTDDLADSTTVFMTELHAAANGLMEDGSRAQAQALRAQVSDAYVTLHPSLFNDREAVQRQSDRMLLQAWLINSLKQSFAQPTTDPADRLAFRSAMRDLGQEVFGIDLTRATIDERGLTPGEVFDALDGSAEEERAGRTADPAGEARRVIDASFGTPCGVEPRDQTQRRLLVLFEGRGRCDMYDPAAYERFLAEVPVDQHYAINYVVWSTGKPLYPADQAQVMDGMIE